MYSICVAVQVQMHTVIVIVFNWNNRRHDDKDVLFLFSLCLGQGCDSEITSMVTEAQSKMDRCFSAALGVTGHLSALSGTEMHVVELGSDAVGKVKDNVSLPWVMLNAATPTIQQERLCGQRVHGDGTAWLLPFFVPVPFHSSFF